MSDTCSNVNFYTLNSVTLNKTLNEPKNFHESENNNLMFKHLPPPPEFEQPVLQENNLIEEQKNLYQSCQLLSQIKDTKEIINQNETYKNRIKNYKHDNKMINFTNIHLKPSTPVTNSTNFHNTTKATSKSNSATIGNYTILKSIGKGNFAVVQLARHDIINTLVAIKVIDLTKLNKTNLNKIYREIDILKKIRKHENILRLYEVIEGDNKIFLITEYCKGGELYEHLVEKQKMNEEDARKYFKQIVNAIECLHKNGIVHRDLKAENLLFNADMSLIKVADFGFSNYYNETNFLSTSCGSPPYAAPELFEGKKYSGPKADIWSLGVVLYVMVCGSFPFKGLNLSDVRKKIINGFFRVPYFVSLNCEKLIRGMLIVDPTKRHSLEQIKNHIWMQETGNQNKSSLIKDYKSNSTLKTNTNEFENKSLNNDNLIDSTLGAISHLSISKDQQAHKILNNEDISEILNNDQEKEELIRDIISIASQFENIDTNKMINSVLNREFDQYYSIYHLIKDNEINFCEQLKSINNTPCSSSSPSPSPPPLFLNIIPPQQRKSSITTGIVEHDNSNTSSGNQINFLPQTFQTKNLTNQSSQKNSYPLNQILNNTQRRHTFGPQDCSTFTNLPTVFLTPPNNLPAANQYYLNYCDFNNLNLCSPNVSLKNNMDSLKPPQFLFTVNNNMSRRASDGQANYGHYLNNIFPIENVECMESNDEACDLSLNQDKKSDLNNQEFKFIESNSDVSKSFDFETSTTKNFFPLKLKPDETTSSFNSTPSPPLGFGNYGNNIKINEFFDSQLQQNSLNHQHNLNQQSQFNSNAFLTSLSPPFSSTLPLSLDQNSNNFNITKSTTNSSTLMQLDKLIPYGSLGCELKEKHQFLRRKRHSLTDTIDLSIRRKTPNSSTITNNSFLYKDFNRRRASEGSNQIKHHLLNLNTNSSSPPSFSNQQYNHSNFINNFHSPSINIASLCNNRNYNLNNCSTNHQQQMQTNQISGLPFQMLNKEVRLLCYSSPPSLQGSPNHQPSLIKNNIQQQQVPQHQNVTYQKPQSPPCQPVQSLQMISEEQTSTNNTDVQQPSINSFLNSSNSQKQAKLLLNNYPLQGTSMSFVRITPPQLFQTSSPIHQTVSAIKPNLSILQEQYPTQVIQNPPSISITDELCFPTTIIPPPQPFAQHSSCLQPSFQLKIQHQKDQTNHQQNVLVKDQDEHKDYINTSPFSMLWKEGSEERSSLVA